MIEFLGQFWFQLITALGITLCTGVCTSVCKKIKKDLEQKEAQRKSEQLLRDAQVVKDSAEQKLLKLALLSLLHDRVYQACTHFISEGHISVEDLRNIDYLYKGYHDLGGNGTGTELYVRVRKLPLDTD